MVMLPRLALTALSVALLAACTVGPDYVRPTPQEPAAFARAPTAAEVASLPEAAPAGDAFWER
ncbi:MAG: RND transporter, partial [Lysobacter sp.]|nr:RND transporter [Lysobacter sp.]